MWAQGPLGVTSGKHFFSVSVTAPGGNVGGNVMVGFLDDNVTDVALQLVGRVGTKASGEAYRTGGNYYFGTAPLAANSFMTAPTHARPCVVGCLLNLDATPARMTVFVDGERLAEQCEYDFPKDGRAWYPSVMMSQAATALHSCAM
jgi:hypothetical protein